MCHLFGAGAPANMRSVMKAYVGKAPCNIVHVAENNADKKATKMVVAISVTVFDIKMCRLAFP